MLENREMCCLLGEKREIPIFSFFLSCPSQLIPALPIPTNKSPTPKFHLNTNGPLSYCQSALIYCDTNLASIREKTAWKPPSKTTVVYPTYKGEIARNCRKWLKCNHVSSLFNVQSCSRALSFWSLSTSSFPLKPRIKLYRVEPPVTISLALISHHVRAHVVNYAHKGEFDIVMIGSCARDHGAVNVRCGGAPKIKMKKSKTEREDRLLWVLLAIRTKTPAKHLLALLDFLSFRLEQ